MAADFSQLFSFSFLDVCEGLLVICCQWVIHDNHIRRNYHRAVEEAIDDILRHISDGTMTQEAGAQQAHRMRNYFFDLMRKNTSPIGLLVAHSIHKSSRPYQYYVEKKAQSLFGSALKDLRPDQAKEVIVNTISSARRPSNVVTDISKRASTASKCIAIVIASRHLFAAVVSENSHIELVRLVTGGFSLIAINKLLFAYINISVSKGESIQKYQEE